MPDELDIIADLYAWVDQDDAIDSALAGFEKRFKACNAGLGLRDSRLKLSSYRNGSAPREIGDEYALVMDEDPWYQKMILVMKAPGAIRGTDLMPQRLYRKCRIYSDFNSRVDVEYMMGCGNPSDAHRSDLIAFLSMQRSRRSGDFSARDKAALNRLTPHVLRSVRMRVEKQDSVCIHAAARFAAIELDRAGIRWMTDVARSLQASGKWFSVLNGNLRLNEDRQQAKLSDILALLLGGRRDLDIGLRHPLTLHSDGSALRIYVLPNASVLPDMSRRYSVILLFLDESLPEHFDLHEFGFSPAETRLACAILSGVSLEQYAKSTSRSPHTIRTQLKSVMHKADVRSQRELVRTLLLNVASRHDA